MAPTTTPPPQRRTRLRPGTTAPLLSGLGDAKDITGDQNLTVEQT
ncbi:hypothetical protein [Mycobacterium leprae]|nr:hypothetical protein [Mycobacterium leprae]